MSLIGGFRSDTVESIKGCCAEEAKNPPIARKYGDIPVSYDSITKEWLTATLARDRKDTSVKNFALGPEDNGSSERRRIEIEWEGAEADKMPKSVFCKAAHSINNRITLSVGGTYTEVCFFNEVRPLIEIEAPTAYFAGYNPDSWAAMIMLKDMGSATHFCTYKTALTKVQFAEQFQILAKLHGRFYQSKEPFFPRLLHYKDRIQNLTSIGIEDACRNGFREARREIPPRLFAREAEIWPATLKSVERNASLPETTVHGDVHLGMNPRDWSYREREWLTMETSRNLGNWYITPSGHMGLTDWQAMARGHWSRDVAYVLGTGVPTEKRRLWDEEMVELYLFELEKAGGPKVTVEEAWLEIRRQSLGALAYWTLTLTPSKLMPDMQTEATTRDFLGRICDFMDDHDVLDAFDF